MALSQLGGSHWSPSSDEKKDGSEPPSSTSIAKGVAAAAAPKNKTLTPTWIFNAAMLSDPVDLSALVTMSRDKPEDILNEIGLLNKMVEKVLNAPTKNKRIDRDTRLDVLTILGNLSKGDEWAKEKIKKVLQGVSSWFEKYVAMMEGADATPAVDEDGNRESPELYKAMLLVLARTFDYNLRTEDLLELTGGNRQIALEAVVGILEDGEVEVTEVAKLATPKEGQRGAWQQRVISIKHEKPLILQMCSLLLGFTRADTYFSALDDGFYFMECGLELPEYCIEKFSDEIDSLLSITIQSNLVGKLSAAMNNEMFQESKVLDNIDHLAIVAVHSFLQNLYLFACDDTDEFRHHILCDTLFIPQLVIPYLDRCIYHAAVMTRRCAANQKALGEFAGYDANTDVQELVEQVSGLSLDYPELVSGMESTLRTLVICSFRAPRTRIMYQLLLRFNPTASLLRMKSFIARHDYLFFLLLVFNINCGSFDMVRNSQFGQEDEEEEEEEGKEGQEEEDDEEEFLALAMLQEILTVYEMQTKEQRMRVLRRVEMSGALPVSRDTSSYSAVLGVLAGSYVNSFQIQMNPAFLLADRAYDEDQDITDDSLCLDGIGPDDDEEEDDDLAQALKGLGGDDDDDDDDVEDYPNYGDTQCALSGTSRSDADPMSETANFELSRKEMKLQAEQRMQSRKEDEENEQLCMSNQDQNDNNNNNPLAIYDVFSEKFNKTMTHKTNQEVMGETWCAEIKEMENEMDFLDSLVAADLTQCREELKALEAEVRMLQNGEDLDMTFDTDDEDDSSFSSSSASSTPSSSPSKEYKHQSPLTTTNPTPISVGALQAPVSSMLMGSFGGSNLGNGSEPGSESGSSNEPESKPVLTSKHQSKLCDDDDDDEPEEKKSDDRKPTIVSSSNATSQAEEKTSTSSSSSAVPSLQLKTMKSQEEKQENQSNKNKNNNNSNSNKTKGKTPRVKTARGEGNLTARATARGKRSLLGDLPSLDKRASQQEIDTFLELKLEIPNEGNNKNHKNRYHLSDRIDKTDEKLNKLNKNNNKDTSSPSTTSVPKEFACAINGHCMRDPYITPAGIIFEKSTILLWLKTRGNICPITHQPLEEKDLKSHKELKTKIMRYHITKSMHRQQTKSSSSSPSSSSSTTSNLIPKPHPPSSSSSSSSSTTTAVIDNALASIGGSGNVGGVGSGDIVNTSIPLGNLSALGNVTLSDDMYDF